MEISSQMNGDLLVATVAAERIDAASAVLFKDTMRSILDGAPDTTVLDLDNVTFVDSSGLGAIVAAMKLVQPGKRLVLARLTPTVQRLFSLTRLDSVFEIVSDVADACDETRQAG